MVETKVTKIGGTLFARIPAEEARRLGITENMRVEMQVRPIGQKSQGILSFKGRYKGRFVKDDGLWGDD